MKTLLRTTALTSFMSLAAGAAFADGKVVVYHWFEYMPQELIEKFTAETGIEVVMDTFDSNEAMLASLKAGGIGTYDVSVPGDYMVEIMAGEGLLDTIADGELANKGNILPEWLNVSYDEGRQHSIPYQWGSTSFMVDTAIYDGDIDSTDILFNPPSELSGKINMLDSQGEVLAMASLHLGIPQCSTDREQLKALNALLMDAKGHWASFNSDTAKEVLASGDVAAGMIFDGYAAKAIKSRDTLKYVFAEQGWVNWMDSVVLLKDAPNRKNALLFMDFLLEPENIAQVSNFARYSNAVKGSEELLDASLKNEPSGMVPDTGKGVFVQTCSEEVQAVYDRIWTELKQ